jgi:hypothetical protein
MRRIVKGIGRKGENDGYERMREVKGRGGTEKEL